MIVQAGYWRLVAKTEAKLLNAGVRTTSRLVRSSYWDLSLRVRFQGVPLRSCSCYYLRPRRWLRRTRGWGFRPACPSPPARSCSAWCRPRCARTCSSRRCAARPETRRRRRPGKQKRPFYFCGNGLPPARTRWVWSTFQSQCPLSSNKRRWLNSVTSIIFPLKILPGIEPRAVGWEARMLPLC